MGESVTPTSCHGFCVRTQSKFLGLSFCAGQVVASIGTRVTGFDARLIALGLHCVAPLIDPRSTHRWLAYGISLHHLSIRASVICQSRVDQLVGISSGETPRGSSTAGSWLETLTIAANTVAPMPQKKPKSQNRNSVIASPLAIHVSNIHRTFSGALYPTSRVSQIELAAKLAIAWSAASMTNRPLGERAGGARWNSAGRPHGAEVSG